MINYEHTKEPELTDYNFYQEFLEKCEEIIPKELEIKDTDSMETVIDKGITILSAKEKIAQALLISIFMDIKQKRRLAKNERDTKIFG